MTAALHKQTKAEVNALEVFLIHRNRDKMSVIQQTTFLNALSSMKKYEFGLKFPRSLFPMVQLEIYQHWSRWWFGAESFDAYMRQSA